jgi:hypothetical protein
LAQVAQGITLAAVVVEHQVQIQALTQLFQMVVAVAAVVAVLH